MLGLMNQRLGIRFLLYIAQILVTEAALGGLMLTGFIDAQRNTF